MGLPVWTAGLISILSAYQIYLALKTGKVGFLFGKARRTRAGNPLLFWGTIIFWLAVILAYNAWAFSQ